MNELNQNASEYDGMSREELIQELKERDHSFSLRWKADMRGIEKWKETTELELVWPDHGDLVSHLMERLAHAESVIDSARFLGKRVLELDVLDERAEEFEIVLHIEKYDATWKPGEIKRTTPSEETKAEVE